MRVEEIMNKNVTTVTADEDLAKVARLICGHKVAGIPVVDEEGGVVGIVSEKDILRSMYPSYAEFTENPSEHMDFERMEERAIDLYSMKVRDVMSANPVTVTPDCPVMKAASMMVARRFRRLPVVDGGRLVGIVSQGDVHCALIGSCLR